MASYIKEGKMADYQDHYYPAEMSVDAQIQTFLINGDVNAFLKKTKNYQCIKSSKILRIILKIQNFFCIIATIKYNKKENVIDTF